VKAGINVSAEYHVASVICGAIVGVCGQAVKKLVHGNIGGFGGGGLLGTQGAEGGKELVVNCTCIVEESANDALDSLDIFCGERRAVRIDMS
jgi:hypothetical protein